MTKVEVLHRLSESWAKLQKSIYGVNPEDKIVPGPATRWSLKDIMGHITDWEIEAIQKIPLVAAGTLSEQEYDIDSWNTIHAAQKQDSTLESIEKEFFLIHQQFVTLLMSLSEEQFASERLIGWIEGCGWGHYDEHTEKILSWRKHMGK